MVLKATAIFFAILLYSISVASADSIHGCGGFVEVNGFSFMSCLICPIGEFAGVSFEIFNNPTM